LVEVYRIPRPLGESRRLVVCDYLLKRKSFTVYSRVMGSAHTLESGQEQEQGHLFRMLKVETGRLRLHALGCLALRDYDRYQDDPEKLRELDGLMVLESPEALSLLFRRSGRAMA
jgi:hypothetical protein